MNKKGWIRIAEAFLAIMIILGAMVFIMARQPASTDTGSSVYDTEVHILDIISHNDSLRTDILSGKNDRINSTVALMIPNNLDFTTIVCNLNDICNPNSPLDKEVYSRDVLITSNLTYYNVKKLRLSVWER